MRLALVALALVVGGCAPPTATHPAGQQSAATVKASRGTVVSTVVLSATVQADAHVEITAPAAGRYSVTDSGIAYELDSGGQGRLALPPGVSLDHALVTGRHVPQNFPLAEARIDGFALVSTLDAAAMYKLYRLPVDATGQIKEGPGPFACPLANGVPRPVGESLSLTCVIPANLTVFAGMPALMAVTTAVARDVVLLPVEAVAGSSQHGQVWLVDGNGTPRLHDVQLGITDGIQIEIRSGVHEGDTVLVPAPDLAPRNRS